jgi:hypothetical protein
MTGRPRESAEAVDRPVGARRSSFVEFKVLCSVPRCGAVLLVLSKRRGAREPWRVWSSSSCPHVSADDVERWRYTPRDRRAGLGLPIVTSTGAAGPRVPRGTQGGRRGSRAAGTNPRAEGTNPRARSIESFRDDVAASLVDRGDGQADT